MIPRIAQERRRVGCLVLVCTLALVALIIPARAGARIYFADYRTSGGIGTAALDGSDLDLDLAGAIDPVGVAVDGEHIYWITAGGAVGRSRLDGSGIEPAFISPGGSRSLLGIAVDGGHIYFSDASSGFIYSANLDGSGLTPILTGLTNSLWGVAVSGDHLYWSNVSTDKIGRANLDGSSPDPNFITGADGPQALATDGGHLYWTNGGDFTIGRANLDGTGVAEQFITNTSTTKSSNYLHGLAVDGAHVYWSSWGSGVNAVGRANLDGAGADPNFITFATGVASPRSVAVDNLPLASTTTLSCAPATPSVDSPTSCTTTVTASGGSLRVPTGSVNLQSSGAGTFAPGATCALTPTSATGSSCLLSYTPTEPGSQTLNAAFGGDYANARSGGSTVLGVRAEPIVKPSNAFRLSHLRLNRRRGIATLTATVPGPGTISMAGRLIRRRTGRARRAGGMRVFVVPSHRTRVRLKRRGVLKVRVRVTYRPTGGDPRTKALTIRLRLRGASSK